jgi:hypothetical protein
LIALSRRRASASIRGSGTHAPIGATSSGLVPQVTIGSIDEPSIRISRLKPASSSLGNVFQ